MNTKEAMNQLKEAMKDDIEYAWGWHCNIAVSAMDEGLDHSASNRAAARFMKNAFDIDTTKCEHFNDTQKG